MTGTKISPADITSFQEKIAKPFIRHLKDNISSNFASSGDVVQALSIFYLWQLEHKPTAISGNANTMLKTMFPNLSKLATISLSIAFTASVERTLSQMKLIKTSLCSRLRHSYLMNIAIETPEKLTD